MKIKKELIQREIAGDTVLVPVGKSVFDSNGLFILNELGAFIWEHLSEAECEGDLTRAVLEEYEVTAAEAEADIADFMKKLRELEII